MNPTVSQEFIDAEFERDSASANAEYNAEFRSDIAEFVSMDVLERDEIWQNRGIPESAGI